MARWMNLPLSLAGRINLIKMIMLPKFLYLFQNIPILIKKSFFNSLESNISSFIWNGKPPRIKRSTLQRPKKLAGLALPNFIFYYWACNIKTILHWLGGESPNGNEAWIRMEFASSSSDLGAILCAPSPPPRSQFCANPVVYHSIRIWSQFRRHFKLQTMSVHSPIKNNYNFPPSLTDSTFGTWASKGINSISSLYVDGKFGSFAQLSQLFDLPSSHFFRFLQIKHFVQKNITSFPDFPANNTVDQILSLTPSRKGLISTLYNCISNVSPHSLQDIRSLWENDLGKELTDDNWKAVLDSIYTSSPCARHNVIQLKIVLRVHLTKTKLVKIFPNVDPSCPRCKGQPADCIHMFWSCPRLNTFWANIFGAYNIMLQKNITPNPVSALFGFIPEIHPKKCPLIAFTSLIARRLILLSWKEQAPPSFTRWIRDVMHFLKLEKTRYTLRGSIQTFRKVWSPFLEFYESLQTPLNKDD